MTDKDRRANDNHEKGPILSLQLSGRPKNEQAQKHQN